MHPIKQFIRHQIARSEIGNQWLGRREFGAIATKQPHAPWTNATLRNEAEVDHVLQQVDELGLPPVDCRWKNWDALGALAATLKHTDRHARILDAGAERYSMYLPWLARYGYYNLTGINLVIAPNAPEQHGRVHLQYGDITHTDFPDSHFDVVFSQSVIEHGVDLEAYFSEMRRILKPGGLLLTSTDYWQDPLDTHGQSAYGVPIKIFSRQDILDMLELAGQQGLEKTGEVELDCDEPLVYWESFDLRYTFTLFTLRKPG